MLSPSATAQAANYDISTVLSPVLLVVQPLTPVAASIIQPEVIYINNKIFTWKSSDSLTELLWGFA